MARKFGVSVEDLDRRTLLSGIAYSLTTDHSVYQPGQPIQITFTETNTGTQPATVSLSPTDFTVNGWQSNPENDGQPPTSVTLQPGHSVSQTATWDGTIMQTAFQPQQGTNLSEPVNQFGTFTVSNPNAPPGDTATFQITNPLQGTLTTNQAIYQLGQPVQVTYAETNTSDQTVTTTIMNPILFRVFHNGQQVTPAMDPLGIDFETLGPGQTAQYHFTLPQADLGGPYTLENLTGSFSVQVYGVRAASGEFTADFQFANLPSGAIASSVSTNQSVYKAGETVTMNFTETNTSDQTVMVPTGQNGFAFDQVLPASYSSTIPYLPGPTMTGWSTLQPGQSWTQTETWPVSDPVSGSYTIKISNFFDLNGNTSTFVVVGGSTSTSGNLSVTTNHSAYTQGESVRATVTIPGTSATSATSREQITVLDGTQVVARLTRRIPASRLKQLDAGRSVTLTTVWNGRPNQPVIHALKPGSYAIDVTYGDSTATAAITIAKKVSGTK